MRAGAEASNSSVRENRRKSEVYFSWTWILTSREKMKYYIKSSPRRFPHEVSRAGPGRGVIAKGGSNKT